MSARKVAITDDSGSSRSKAAMVLGLVDLMRVSLDFIGECGISGLDKFTEGE